MAEATVKTVKEFFGMDLKQMKAEWVQGGLTPKDKEQILGGLTDGTLTYE